MQKVVAYLLERRDGMQWPETRAVELGSLKDRVAGWLRSKGASDDGSTGTYLPEDGSVGTFSYSEAADGERNWWMVQLREDNFEGRRFAVALSITSTFDRVSVYVTLEAGWATTRIMPVSIDPRCPRVVRDLLLLPGSWYHGQSILHHLQRVNGFDGGEALAAEILHPDRAVPLIVVSTDTGNLALPDLDEKLAYDLAGTANVVVLDEDAAWALTDMLGRDFSCYRGAVRLFWPHCSLDQDCYLHPLWTSDRLQTSGDDPFENRDRFRSQLRARVFRAAALSVVRPRAIDEIRDASAGRAVAELRKRATSLAEYKELADSYAAENDDLRAERSMLRARVEDLETQVAKLDAACQALHAHLSAVKRPSRDQHESDDILPVAATEVEVATPIPGEVRFYKKVYSRPSRDVMKRVQDCGCNNWDNAHAADKARKGIAKLELGRTDWVTLQHCSSCTGGGMWRVRW